MHGEYLWNGKKYPSYEDYVMSIRVDEIAEATDFVYKLEDIRKRIKEVSDVADRLHDEAVEWVELAEHFKKELK